MTHSSAALDSFRARGRLLRLAELSVFVIDTGPSDEDPVLLLHGFPSSSLDFHRLLPHLSGRRVVLLDMPGYGFSDKPIDYSYSLHEQTDVLLLVLRELKVSAAHVVAHDMGTSIACELAARRERGLLPFRMRSLVLMNGSVHIELAHLTPSQKILRTPLGPLLARLSSAAIFKAQLRRIQGHPMQESDLDDMWALLRQKDGHLRLPQLISYVDERHRFWHRWIGALCRLDLPTLVLWATADPVAVLAIGERLASEIPGARYERLEGLGHYPQLEEPQAVAAALLRHLARPEVSA